MEAAREQAVGSSAPPPLKLLLVAGTRPEVIKLAPVVWELQRQQAVAGITHDVAIIHQHDPAMLRPLMDELGVEASSCMYFTVRRNPGDLNQLLVGTLDWVSLALSGYDMVMVQGDTTTALGVALAAYHQQIPIAHVEAGLRTYAVAPYPEEVNRRAIDSMATLMFTPTQQEADNLAAERLGDSSRVHTTGNTGVDALHWAIQQLHARGDRPPADDCRRVLVTLHRRENRAHVDGIMKAIAIVAETSCGPPVRFTVVRHPNGMLDDYSDTEAVKLVPPMGYVDMIAAVRHARAVITDSGGLQEDCGVLGVPCGVMRVSSERETGYLISPRGDTGWVTGRIRALLERWLSRPDKPALYYGDGRAAERIVARVRDWWRSDGRRQSRPHT